MDVSIGRIAPQVLFSRDSAAIAPPDRLILVLT
jgi:hypothetical protein